MLGKAVANKTHELPGAENPFALWINTIDAKQRETNTLHVTVC